MLNNKLSLSAILLAGGKSKRMGINKAFLKIGEKTFIDIIYQKMNELFSEIIIVTDSPQKLSHLKARITPDLIRKGKKCLEGYTCRTFWQQILPVLLSDAICLFFHCVN